MPQVLYDNAGRICWGIFLVFFLTLGLLEGRQPLERPELGAVVKRWTMHAFLLVLSNAILSAVYYGSGVSLAMLAASSPVGTWQSAHIPDAVRFVGTVLVLDLTRYIGHVTFHSVGAMWRVHQLHHSDRGVDLTTALRFHPLETLGMHGLYLLAVVILAPLPLAVLVTDLITVAQVQFIHANAVMPTWLERFLRNVIVTPRLHRIHHSTEMADQNSNFGTVFLFWDQLFRTYRAEPVCGFKALHLGLPEIGLTESLQWSHILLPFRQPRSIVGQESAD